MLPIKKKKTKQIIGPVALLRSPFIAGSLNRRIWQERAEARFRMEGNNIPESAKPPPATAAADKPNVALIAITNLDTLFDDDPVQQAALDAANKAQQQAAKGSEGNLKSRDHSRYTKTQLTDKAKLKQDAQMARQRRVNLLIGAALSLVAVFFLASLGATLFTKKATSQLPTPPVNSTAWANENDNDDIDDDASAKLDSEEEKTTSRVIVEADTNTPEPLEDGDAFLEAEGLVSDSTGPQETRHDAEHIDNVGTTYHSSTNSSFGSQSAVEKNDVISPKDSR